MHKIYWFSGTGNTLYVAREFAKSFPDAKLHSIASLDRAADVELGSEMTGIFFPAYCMGIPHIIEQFLARVVPQEKGNNGKFIYAVCTSGGYPGGALPMIEDTLAEKGINLNASFHIRMPSNYIPLSNPPNEKQQAALFVKADRAIRIAVIAVKKRRKTRPLRVFPIDTFLKFVSKRAVATLETSDKYFRADENCDGCGLCSRLCPAANISLDDEERPVWHHHCEQCMACLQWCPKQAIQYRDLTATRTRYHNPFVSASELYRVKDDGE